MDTKLKQLIAKANLATNSNVGTISQRANKNKEKIEKLQTFDLSYFLGKIFLVMMIFKTCLFCNQPLIC